MGLAAVSLALLVGGLLIALGGCSPRSPALGSPAAVPTATPPPAEAPAPTPTAGWERLGVNELGKVLILEYHRVGPAEERWARSYANFRRDLETLYAKGYRLIGLNDFLANRIAVPAGYSPLILTFDDSSDSQFRYIASGGELKVDPNSALGMLEEFYTRHPDFGLKATFFVLPAAAPPNDLFNQPAYAQRKLQYLVQRGLEIGNHTYWHQPLGQVDNSEAQQQLALAAKAIQEAVPGYRVTSLALPQGEFPRDPAVAIRGSYQGFAYQHQAILLVGAEPAPSPNRRDYDPYSLPRVQAIPTELDRWLAHMDNNPQERFVSDGNPDRLVFPVSMEKHYRAEPGHQRLPDPAPGYRAMGLR